MTMSRAFVALNAVLAVVSLLFVLQIWRSIVAPSPTARGVGRRPAPSAPRRGPDVTPAEPRVPLASYSVIGTKNLFSPGRTEGAAAAGPAAAGPRPFLYGVVVATDLSIAYLEDPASRRVTGYRIGDPIAGGTLTAITPDHVVLKRADGMIDVQLRDPAKPRAVPEAPAGAPGVRPPAGAPSPVGLPQPTMPPIPGALPQPLGPSPVPGVLPQPPGPSAAPGGLPQPVAVPAPTPGGPPAPPTLLRRLPGAPVPGAPSARPDAPDR
jgi:hypothetical protein